VYSKENTEFCDYPTISGTLIRYLFRNPVTLCQIINCGYSARWESVNYQLHHSDYFITFSKSGVFRIRSISVSINSATWIVNPATDRLTMTAIGHRFVQVGNTIPSPRNRCKTVLANALFLSDKFSQFYYQNKFFNLSVGLVLYYKKVVNSTESIVLFWNLVSILSQLPISIEYFSIENTWTGLPGLYPPFRIFSLWNGNDQ